MRTGVQRYVSGAMPYVLALGTAFVGACASSSPSAGPAPNPDQSTAPPRPDPRVGLAPGQVDSAARRITQKAGEAAWNMRLVSNTPSPVGFEGVTNSDLAFSGNLAIQGNYNGFLVWDIANAQRPALKKSFLCPASQNDVSIFNNLLFVSSEGTSARLDCGTTGVRDTVSHERIRGVRIFDASDITNPKYIGNVQTCRGSHTHTVVSDPNDRNNVYIYISGNSRSRSPTEVPGCTDAFPEDDPNSIRFRIEVIQVPLANPTQARVINNAPFLAGLEAPPRRTEPATGGGGGGGRGGRAGGAGGAQPAQGAPPPRRVTGPTQCHDITVYPALGLAGGACGGYGLLLDIRDVKNPRRLYAAADSNMSFWHSATFSNDGTKVLFTDEWGGGSAPRCRDTDRPEWGANAIFTIENNQLHFKSYYKIPAAQTSLENCVAHNGSLIPIPGREVMVQGWYQGGISVFDWTDPARPVEIAFFDRGPVDANRMRSAGSWSVYWYNGYMVSSEIFRGLDIFELTPSGFLSQNEIDAAKSVRYAQLNAQEQPKMVWPPSFALARAYVDQLERAQGLPGDRIATIRNELTRAERASGEQRRAVLTQLAAQATGGTRPADQAKVRLLAAAITELANAQR